MAPPVGCCIIWRPAHLQPRNAPVRLMPTTQFQLVKHYPSGGVIEVRTITKPVPGTVKVYLEGIQQLSGWSVDATTGLVTFGTLPAMASRSPPTSSSMC